MVLLVCYDEVDVVGTAETITIWWEVGSHDFRTLVRYNVEKTRNLVHKAVVALLPNCGGYEDVEEGSLGSSFDFVAFFESFAMLVDHRVNEVDEGLVGLKETVAA